MECYKDVEIGSVFFFLECYKGMEIGLLSRLSMRHGDRFGKQSVIKTWRWV